MRFKPALLLLLAFCVPSAWAEGIPVEPGLWEMTTTMNMPMMPQPRTTTTRECMTDSVIDMDDVGAGTWTRSATSTWSRSTAIR